MVNLMIGCVPAGFESSPSRIQITDATDCTEFQCIVTMNEATLMDNVAEYSV